ncbi:hypothetical protein ACQQ2N_12145 [Dokdonella sp. MW10]|uniref:hypothetical protein n=1 Tax=Dokdonella sp. MW10 TaxID=2992926 RepID=UPI003F818A10
MKILVTGRGGAGSWTVRGEQLGAALGAQVKPAATRMDLVHCDIAIAVKRVPESLLATINASGKPWVYDVVDAYPQPEASGWSRDEAIRWMQRRLAELSPDAIIWPTQRMREDCDTGRTPGIVLPHHHRPGIASNPIRERVAVVGYEGAAHYLGGWESTLRDQCRDRGWSLALNPASLSDVDIVVALRGAPWTGYAQRHWKSNVKLANAHASGTPFIGQAERGYVETATGAEYWAENAAELRVCFDWLDAMTTREQVHDRFIQAAYSVERAARDLEAWLRGL